MSAVPGRSLSHAIADYLGLTDDALRDGLRSGSTLLDAVAATGRTVDGLRRAVAEALDAGLYKAVRDGRLTVARAAALQAHTGERADRIIGLTA